MASSNRVKRQKLCIAFPPLRPRDVGDGWAEFAIAHKSFGRSVNPICINQRGQIVNPTLLFVQPALGSFLRPCMRYTPLSSFGVILPSAEKQVTDRFANYFRFLNQQLMHLFLKSILVNFFVFIKYIVSRSSQ